MWRKELWIKFVALLLVFPVASLNTPFPLFAQAEGPEQGKSTKAEAPKLKEGEITGKVTKTDGKTVLPDIPITVVDTKTGEIIATVKTDKDGRYSLPELKPGKYRLVIAHRMVVEIEVVSESETAFTSLNLLLPEAFLEPPAEEEEEKAGVAWYKTKAAVVTFIVLLGGATAALLADGDGDGEVSPSVP